MSGPAHARPDRGFTLVEILVVLVILALLTGVAMPRVQRLARSIEISSQRKDLLVQVDGLAYRAFREARALELASLPRRDDGGAPEAALRLPEGWRLDVAKPIRYAFNGLCSGGRFTLSDPDGVEYSYELKAPACRVAAID